MIALVATPVCSMSYTNVARDGQDLNRTWYIVNQGSPRVYKSRELHYSILNSIAECLYYSAA